MIENRLRLNAYGMMIVFAAIAIIILHQLVTEWWRRRKGGR